MTNKYTFIFAFSYLIAGALTAYTAWNFSTALVVFSSLLFFVYLLSPQRSAVAYYVIGFYMMTLRGLPSSVSYYYHSYFLAFFTWALSIVIIMVVYALFWNHSFKKRILLFPFMVLVLTLPPVGILAGANPLASSGIIFPGFGIWGIVLYLLSVMFLSVLLHAFKYKKWTFPILISVLFGLAALWRPLADPVKKFKTTVTHFLYTPTLMNHKEKSIIAEALLKKSKALNANKILFFENALGDFQPEDSLLWKALDDNKRIYAGAYLYDDKKVKYDNTLVKITNKGSTVIYKQRIPLLLSMWVPFSSEGAQAYLFENPVVVDEGERLGIFICYEQVLAFPFIHTMMHKPTVLLGMSNLWWGRDDTFLDAQKINLSAWASLMGIPVYFSFNDRD